MFYTQASHYHQPPSALWVFCAHYWMCWIASCMCCHQEKKKYCSVEQVCFLVHVVYVKLCLLLLSEMVGSQCVLCEQPPRVATAFHSHLHRNLLVQRRSLQELQPFSSVSSLNSNHQRAVSWLSTVTLA